MGTGDGDDPGADPRQIGDGGGDGPPIPGKSGMAVGMDPRSPQIGDGGGDGDRGFRALGQGLV